MTNEDGFVTPGMLGREPVKRKPGRPPKPKPEKPIVEVVKEKLQAAREMAGHDQFAAGMKFAIAKLGWLAEVYDPMRLMKIFLDVRAAEMGFQAPKLIDVTWTSSKQPWLDEYDRLHGSRGPTDIVTPETANVLKQQGRPRKEDVEWT